MKKYLVFPGPVVSKNDGDLHYITADQLMRLYKVKPLECVVIRDHDDLDRIAHANLVKLYPCPDGNYQILE